MCLPSYLLDSSGTWIYNLGLIRNRTSSTGPALPYIVSENKLQSIVAPKALNGFKKSDLSDDLNYEVLCCIVIPTVITYYTHQKDPWDQQPSLLCNEICIILKLADMDVNPKWVIYKNISTLYFHSYYPHSFKLPGHSVPLWQLASSHCFGVPDTHHSVNLWEPTMYQCSISRKRSQHGQQISSPTTTSYTKGPKVKIWAYVVTLNIVHYLILSTKEWWGLFCSSTVIGTFVAHLPAAQRARSVPELKVRLAQPPYDVLLHSLQLG